jgi:hypothetical protein
MEHVWVTSLNSYLTVAIRRRSAQQVPFFAIAL